jgi:NAD(P)-dependent dehydrogenase (short-subunit alcohol dehydrogenase family)
MAKDKGITVAEALSRPTAGPGGSGGPPPIPLGRLGTPEDVAYLVSFLVSDRSGYITGEDINITGGAS